MNSMMKRSLVLLSFAMLVTACNGPSSNVSATNPTNTVTTTPPTRDGASIIKLSWNASTGGPTGYEVDSSTDGTTFTQIQTVTGTTTQVTGLARGKTYYFRIRAMNGVGDSAFTSKVSVAI